MIVIADVGPATQRDAARIVALLEAAAEWMVANGIRQWAPGEVRLADIEAQVDGGEWCVARSPTTVIAAFRLLLEDRTVWGHDDDANALYVHGLVIDRGYAGTGLGAGLLRWAAGHARELGADLLRLDCVASNQRLHDYYRGQGFREVGRRDFDRPVWSAVLFERSVR